MEQESVHQGLGCQAILPVLLGGRPPRKQEMISMHSAVRQARAKGRPMTTRMVEGTFHAIYMYTYMMYMHMQVGRSFVPHPKRSRMATKSHN